jgi:predicted phage-related endonuclease
MGKFEKLCNEYRENKRLIEELEALNSGLKSAIIALMDGRETVAEGATKASYKVIFSSRFDSKALREERPDIFAKYSRRTSSKRFTVI